MSSCRERVAGAVVRREATGGDARRGALVWVGGERGLNLHPQESARAARDEQLGCPAVASVLRVRTSAGQRRDWGSDVRSYDLARAARDEQLGCPAVASVLRMRLSSRNRRELMRREGRLCGSEANAG